MTGWDDPETAACYESFCRAHPRYTRANEELIARAAIEPWMRVLDVGAGTGRTAEAALARLGGDGRVVCVEPSAAMRAEAARRIADRRVAWLTELTDAAGPFDRILCGAAIWQLDPLPETIRRLSALLSPAGALCFNIPALYLLEPDEPGGGSDPLLLSLPAMLWTDRADPRIALSAGSMPRHRLTRQSVGRWLRGAGLRGRSWTFRLRLTQEEYAGWLRIPVVATRLLPECTAAERSRRIDAVLQQSDRSSWKWERWRGWTAWKR
jgi:SAM-dependent methyltransferase